VFKYQSDISWIVFRYQLDSVQISVRYQLDSVQISVRYQLDSVQISVANVTVLGLTVCLNLRFVSPALICVSSSEEKRVFSVEINDGF
jgi:hypothetical protein